MVGTCTAHVTLLTRGMALMAGFLLLLWSGMGHAAETPNDILIGATLPLSGRFTPMAGTFDRLCQSWAKLVNAQGGIYVKAYDKNYQSNLSSTMTRVSRPNRRSSTSAW